MSVCPECDSQVAENDIYCPYCGISLERSVAPVVEDDPFAHTIAISASEAASTIQGSTSETIHTANPEPPSADAIAETGIDNVPALSNIDTASVARAKTSADINKPSDIDAPAEKIQEPAQAADLIIPQPSSDNDEFESKDLKELSISNTGTVSATPIEDTSVSDDSPVEKTPQPQETFTANVPFVSSAAPITEISEPSATEPVIEERPLPETSAGSPSLPLDNSTSAPILLQETTTQDVPVVETVVNAETSSASVSDTGGKKTGLKPLTEGTVLNNRYEILKKIGGGGMGAVYLSNDRNLGGVQRAVKEMVQAHIEETQQEKAIDDFRRESMILSSLDHPSIPTIYDYFFDADEGRFYLVMKYIGGGDLAGRLRAAPEGRIDELTVTEWGFQIADVLSYLHDLPQRIVYRDLKPSNVMLDGSTGKVMLIDFGIARSVNQVEEKGVTAVGTMGYAPPELFSGNVEPRSDIYSLGSTMFHLMTGADPQNNPLLIFDFEKNPRPRQINPRLTDQIERILMRAVEYNADKRFSSAAELRDLLGDHADKLRAGRVTYGVGEAPLAAPLADELVFCGFCGQRIVAADLFCAFCGAKQPLATHNVRGVRPQVSPRAANITARLIVDGTTELDAPMYLIEKSENLVGRRDPMSNIFPEVDLSKFDPQTKISRRHARILHDGANYLVEDLGSSNGTILISNVSAAMRLLPHRPHPLMNGDRIRLGDTTLHFLLG